MSVDPSLVPPWAGFLDELDELLDDTFELHCVGGFAIVAAYGLPRSTNDLDYFTLIPFNRVQDLERIAGHGSALARKHKVQVHLAAIASVPEDYERRMTELFPQRFKHLRLFVLDAYDLVLSKLSRNVERDREDVAHLARTCHLDGMILRDRYVAELRPILIGDARQHDLTLKFWIDAYFPPQS
jgi:Nucleotidyltransferase of unknown function (DUF6036)